MTTNIPVELQAVMLADAPTTRKASINTGSLPNMPGTVELSARESAADRALVARSPVAALAMAIERGHDEVRRDYARAVWSVESLRPGEVLSVRDTAALLQGQRLHNLTLAETAKDIEAVREARAINEHVRRTSGELREAESAWAAREPEGEALRQAVKDAEAALEVARNALGGYEAQAGQAAHKRISWEGYKRLAREKINDNPHDRARRLIVSGVIVEDADGVLGLGPTSE